MDGEISEQVLLYLGGGIFAVALLALLFGRYIKIRWKNIGMQIGGKPEQTPVQKKSVPSTGSSSGKFDERSETKGGTEQPGAVGDVGAAEKQSVQRMAASGKGSLIEEADQTNTSGGSADQVMEANNGASLKKVKQGVGTTGEKP